MTHSEFLIAVDEEFGPLQGRALVRDLVVDELGHITGQQALADGVAPRDVWRALCTVMDVPLERQHGVGRAQPLSDTPA